MGFRRYFLIGFAFRILAGCSDGVLNIQTLPDALLPTDTDDTTTDTETSTDTVADTVPDTGEITSTPFSGTPFAIPGVVEVEDYDFGGEGVSWHELTAGNNAGLYREDDVDIGASETGYGISYVSAGEWLLYTVDVQTTGTYDFTFRSATINDERLCRVSFNGIDKTGEIPLTNTGDYNIYVDIVVTGIPLDKGIQTMQLYAVTHGFNMDFISIQLSP